MMARKSNIDSEITALIHEVDDKMEDIKSTVRIIAQMISDRQALERERDQDD